jgi:hypothetical protein
MPGQNSRNLCRHECHHPAFMTQLLPATHIAQMSGSTADRCRLGQSRWQHADSVRGQVV